MSGAGECASTLAAAGPPMRGCRITMKLAIATGNTANMPEANEPMLWLAVVTTTTNSATVSARSGMSNAAALHAAFLRRHLIAARDQQRRRKDDER